MLSGHERSLTRSSFSAPSLRHLPPSLRPSPAELKKLTYAVILAEVVYNAEGDLLFSCAKDHVINAWHSHNGERLGTYDGHNGTVWTVGVDCAFLLFLSRRSSRARDALVVSQRQTPPS